VTALPPVARVRSSQRCISAKLMAGQVEWRCQQQKSWLSVQVPHRYCTGQATATAGVLWTAHHLHQCGSQHWQQCGTHFSHTCATATLVIAQFVWTVPAIYHEPWPLHVAAVMAMTAAQNMLMCWCWPLVACMLLRPSWRGLSGQQSSQCHNT
jgi:hypothetical protein